MSEDLDLILDAYEELSPEDKILFIDYNIDEYRELKKTILKDEKKEYWKQKYNDPEFRKRQNERQKKYRLKKKMEKEKNKNINKDAGNC